MNAAIGPIGGDAPAPSLTEAPFGPGTGLDLDLAPAGMAGSEGGLAILGIALLGGLILNLMPCVLPVLSVKLLGVIDKGGRGKREIRLGFLAAAAGILAAFMGLAGGVIAARAAGVAVGWGFQFQQPLFLIGIALICAVFAANLWGLFEVALPQAVAGRIPPQERGDGLLGDFSTGVFATILATPCSAPFLGTAISFALPRGPLDIVSVFAALGVGLALPYLAVALMPGLAGWLPRPGRWMITLRRVLAGALLATSVWLITILAAQAGSFAAVLVSACLVALLLLLWARRARPGLRGMAFAAPAALLVSVALAAPGLVPPANSPSRPGPAEGLWRPFEPDRIPALVREGRIVLVDVSADWCLTCHVNKQVVLDRDPVASQLKRADVVAMAADWTRPSERISAFLARFNRFGIPFTVVYGPGAEQGIPLPELLSSHDVIAALEGAGAR